MRIPLLSSFLARRREAARASRAAQRHVDATVLWPRLWLACDGDPAAFLSMTAHHTSRAPAWRYFEEWDETPENPGRWAARRFKEGIHGPG